MRPVHKLHLYQPNDRFATVVTSGSSHRFCVWRCSPAVRCLCGSNPRHEGRDEAGAYTASLSAERPLRHRRNLRQLPQVLCLAMQPGSTLSLWEQPEARGSR
jgi:hypothetical protein